MKFIKIGSYLVNKKTISYLRIIENKQIDAPSIIHYVIGFIGGQELYITLEDYNKFINENNFN